MKPSALEKRTGNLTMEQYLGLVDGMSLKVAGRMLTLAGDITNDVIRHHEAAAVPGLDRAALTGLARAATTAETHLARLLVLARSAPGRSRQSSARAASSPRRRRRRRGRSSGRPLASRSCGWRRDGL